MTLFALSWAAALPYASALCLVLGVVAVVVGLTYGPRWLILAGIAVACAPLLDACHGPLLGAVALASPVAPLAATTAPAPDPVKGQPQFYATLLDVYRMGRRVTLAIGGLWMRERWAGLAVERTDTSTVEELTDEERERVVPRLEHARRCGHGVRLSEGLAGLLWWWQ